MTQFGEPIAIGIIDDPDSPGCPFSHETPPESNPGENELIGSGSELAKQLKSQRSTDLVAKPKPDRVENPRYIETHSFHSPSSLRGASAEVKASWPVTISVNDEIHKLPVRCAAHHLIPAQEALKDSRLVPFMVHLHTAEPVKGGTVKGKLWRDVGYNVNGSENGVYLPGSYAVGGGRGGLRVWSTADEPDLEEEDIPGEDADGSAYLTGSPESMTETTPKWQYVRQAMLGAPGQFHDRHGNYSSEVQLKLDSIAAALAKKYRHYEERTDACPCSECEKTRSKWSQIGYPPPAGLVARLNGVSARLKGFVNGSTWAMNLFTSKWGQAYMTARAAGKAWAKI
ncbi:AHH domain-containing protein [Niveibacterium sp. 24ML]|uniref:AHH domain-containing protein n=1 Tax=Niveibacterium sp. 24ML TaxID=2985512 RepID=UPI00226F8B7C|nr:AHH domain-containing protein [Niveibacterium sp. 24ML]MCX9156606.1 AHH domain-containing protein [Niveibacterium sp. 24ML]